MSLVPRPYLPRVLTCLAAGLLLSLTVFIPGRQDDGKQHIYITPRGEVGDIKRALNSLGRSDIDIRYTDTGPFQMDVFEGWIFVLILGTVISALGWAGISFIFAIIRNLLESQATK
jgi:hypothetical protein